MAASDTTVNEATVPTLDWSDVAAGWDAGREHVEQTNHELTARLLAGLGLSAGDRVLELGAGTGELARQLAEAVGPEGHVLATDIAAGMVELIARTTSDLPTVETARLDASETGLADASYDAIVFRMGLMLLAEPDVALAEFHRLLRPGGRLAAATWAAPENNPWLVCVGLAGMLNGVISGGLPIEPGGPMSLSDPAALEQLARDAGFAEVSVEVVETPFRASNVDQHIERVASLAPPLAAGFAAASAEQRAAVSTAVEDMMKGYRTDDGLVIPGQALLLHATR